MSAAEGLKGSRNKLGECFIADLKTVWESKGMEALERCAEEEPARFCAIIAGLMPRDLNVSLGIDVASFAASFETAMQTLGIEQPPRRPELRGMKVRTLSAASYAEAEVEMAALEAAGVKSDGSLAGLTSPEMLLAFMFRDAQADGHDEERALDLCELLVRSCRLNPDEVREHARVLGRIGFASLADRLKTIAGRRKVSLKPLI